jgi:UDP-N-acetylmuramyl pentapeptide phosphotransferase/UDP-N-acetylglucosamine-1-phosphate transferase
VDQIIFCCLSSFALTSAIIPSLLRIADRYSIYDIPNARKSHSDNIPRLGGIGIFIGFILSVLYWADSDQIQGLQFILLSVFCLFFLGMKDDLLQVRAYKKLFIQIIAAFVVVHYADIRISSLYGLFWIYDINIVVSYTLTIFTLVVITNSFNLIDGINTLATTQAIWASLAMGTWFTLFQEYQYALLSFSMMGALLGYLRFNWSPAKIFMGDTGSTFIGFTLGILMIQFIEFNRFATEYHPYQIFSVPAVAIAILIIPLFDTLRVFILRSIKGKSPFAPDRSHLHHLLVDRGLGHEQASFVLLGLSCFCGISVYSFQHREGEILLLFLICVMTLFTYVIKRIQPKGNL